MLKGGLASPALADSTPDGLIVPMMMCVCVWENERERDTDSRCHPHVTVSASPKESHSHMEAYTQQCNAISGRGKLSQRTSVEQRKAKSSPLGDGDHGQAGIWMGQSFPTRPNND